VQSTKVKTVTLFIFSQFYTNFAKGFVWGLPFHDLLIIWNLINTVLISEHTVFPQSFWLWGRVDWITWRSGSLRCNSVV
jgi:hypothetical protein